MPRYFFDMRDGDVFSADEEGEELPDVVAAQAEAAATLVEMIVDLAKREHSKDTPHPMAVEARDIEGPLFVLRYDFVRSRLFN